MAPTKCGRRKKRVQKFRKPPPVLLPANEIITDDNEDDETVNIEINGKTLTINIFEDLVIRDKRDIRKEEESVVLSKLKQLAENSRSGPNACQSLLRSLPTPKFRKIPNYNIPPAPPRPNNYIRFIEMSPEDLDSQVEYDMDEDDMIWLEIMNEERTKSDFPSVSMDMFELLMDRLEKESYFHVKLNEEADSSLAVIDDEAVCSICLDGECQNSNVILFCDMCNLAVHQDCYGVPYIPEGHWLCRRCLHSPSTPVECVLCPNNGGAFKQTDRGHWAHVVCALWIPEVRFANTVFLEPIDSIECITTARWRLICYICKQRGVGACIQCERPNCYSAFHVTCAQQAGLYMKMETASSKSGAVEVKKVAFCDAHTPEDAENRPCLNSMIENRNNGNNNSCSSSSGSFKSSSTDKVKNARKALAKKRSLVPVISIPTIPPERIQEIGSLINIPKKSYFIQRLLGYWTLKRQFRHGVPLLRRLQSAHSARRDENRSLANIDHLEDKELLAAQQNYWHHVRQDLERCRLMCELVQKRERKKKELLQTIEETGKIEMSPLNVLMDQMIKIFKAKDTGEIFLEPVDVTEVPDYRDFITHPMDLQTMQTKLEHMGYHSLEELEADFNLMLDNCLLYNSKDTKFYRAALRMRELGILVFNDAKQYLVKYPLNEETFVFNDPEITLSDENDDVVLPTKPLTNGRRLQLFSNNVSSTEEVKAKEIDEELKCISQDDGSVDHNSLLIKLLQLQEKCKLIKHKAARMKRLRSVRSQMWTIKRRLIQQGLSYTPAHYGYASARVPNTPSSSSSSSYTPNYAASFTTPYTPSYNYDFETPKKASNVYAPILEDMNMKSKESFGAASLPGPSTSMSQPTDFDKDSAVAIQKDGAKEIKKNGPLRMLIKADTFKIPEVPSTSANLSPKPSTSSGSTPVKKKRGQRSASSSQCRPIIPNSDSFKVYRLNKDVQEGEETDDDSVRSDDESSSSHSSSSCSSDESSDSDQSSDSYMINPNNRNKYVPENGDDEHESEHEVEEEVADEAEEELEEEGDGEEEQYDDDDDDDDDEGNNDDTDENDDNEEESKEPQEDEDNDNDDDNDNDNDNDDDDNDNDDNDNDNDDYDDDDVGDGSNDVNGAEDSDESLADTDIDVNSDLNQLQPVWAKCTGFPWHPALIINPKMKLGYIHNGVPIPTPPKEVLDLGTVHGEPVYLVLFYDAKRTWQWLPRNKLHPLGVDDRLDRIKLNESRKSGGRKKGIRKAYLQALVHKTIP